MQGVSQLRQESIVEIADRQVTVLSEVIVDPEVLVRTRVLSDGRAIKTSHVPIPAAAVADYESRGPQALSTSLQAQHFRFIRDLLSTGDDERSVVAPPRTGILATLVLGAAGEVVQRAGEEQVPGSWLRAMYLIAGVGDRLGASLGLGPLARASSSGPGIHAILRRDGPTTTIHFLDPANAAPGTVQGLELGVEEGA